MKLEWISGLNSYRRHTLEFGPVNTFTVELIEDPETFANIEDCLLSHLDGANYPIEVLYSGGLDSEFVIATCREFNIPIIAITMRLLLSGSPINTHDLYYAEKFCRKYEVAHRIVDLDIEKFFSNGDHIKYLEPYRINNVASATIMHLIDQCHTFPVFGGDYSWPLTNIGLSAYSPHNHKFNCYDHYISTKGEGIGNMLGYSNYSNLTLIREHLKMFDDTTSFKHKIFKNLRFDLEPRHKSHGWENINLSSNFDISLYASDLHDRYGLTKNTIKWNNSMGKLIGTSSGEYFEIST